MKKQILKLRSKGKTYDEIIEIVGCSKGTVSYHCGEGQKEKALNRQKIRRKNKLIKKVDTFKYGKKSKKYFMESVRKFNKRTLQGTDKSLDMNFSYLDVIKKFGIITKCYLSGVEINLTSGDYELDHIIPTSRGGSNSLSNLGILDKNVNQAKRGLLNKEFIELCKLIIENNGYKLIKIQV